MIVKVCGMREPENIRAVERAGADWMGFIFYARSPRCVAAPPSYLPAACRRVGVFVGERTDTIVQQAVRFGLSHVQLHGRETAEECRRLRAEGLTVIKAFSVKGTADVQAATAYEGACDYFLFDTACTGYGGSGVSFDWNALHAYCGHTPFLLSGGLRPDSMEALARFHHPRWAGIDLNSGFETAPARKDAAALKTFIEQAKQLEP